jgi:predicted molibdopterin-dependent oxidoreductase YjgC
VEGQYVVVAAQVCLCEFLNKTKTRCPYVLVGCNYGATLSASLKGTGQLVTTLPSLDLLVVHAISCVHNKFVFQI